VGGWLCCHGSDGFITKDEMEFMNIEYKINASISTAQFISLLERSTLGERRPINDTSLYERYDL
jgi:hypothetical protein